jgi:hypothetical protein
MEELMPEAKQIYDLLKISTKEVVEDHFNAYRSSAMQAMSAMIKDNDGKFSSLNAKVDDAMTEIRHALDKFGSASSSPTMSSPAAVMVGSQHVAGEETDGQFGPRGDHHGRRSGTYVPPPARCTRDVLNPIPVDRSGDEFFWSVLTIFLLAYG